MKNLRETLKIVHDDLDYMLGGENVFPGTPRAEFYRSKELHRLKDMVRKRLDEPEPEAPVRAGDYDVEFAGTVSWAQAKLVIVGGPYDGRSLFIPTRLLFPPRFRVRVDHTLWDGTISNRVRRLF